MTHCDYDNRVPGENRVGNWMQTWQGGRFFPLDPRPDEVFIEDIAAALGKLCRFGGHCHRFYSVAEHSVHVSYLVPAEHALVALLHDASEAYVADIPRPLKAALTDYGDIEEKVWIAIADRFGLPHDHPPCIKEADNAMLLREAAEIMAQPPELWKVSGTPADRSVIGLMPAKATEYFLKRFAQLTGAAS